LRDGELSVVTASSAWSQQLGLLGPQIVAALAQRVPEAGVTALRFRVGNIRPRRAGRGGTRRGDPRPCADCGAGVEGDGRRCAPCEGADALRRRTALERTLYETPWLPFLRLAAEMPGLTREEYERVRSSLLDRWWEVLSRAGRSRSLRRDGLERRLASSYVILHSRLEADRITPAIVRNLLGEELWSLLYGAEGNGASSKSIRK
jgi:hypothetical protein